MGAYYRSEVVTLSGSIVGGTFASAYPVVTRLGTYNFEADVAIVGVALSASSLIYAGIGGVFVLGNVNDATASVGNLGEMLATYLSRRQDPNGAAPTAANDSEFFSFSGPAWPVIGRNAPVSLYGNRGTDTDGMIYGIAALHYIPLRRLNAERSTLGL